MAADADPAMPLLWVPRDVLNMTGTKHGCGVAVCGACTVRIHGHADRSCVIPAYTVVGKSIQTIESLGTPDKPHALQSAWIARQVPQCGYCQGGMLMAAAALLEKHRNPRTPILTQPSPTSAVAVRVNGFAPLFIALSAVLARA